MVREGFRPLSVILLTCSSVCFLVGCGSGGGSSATPPWFIGEYVDPSHPTGALRLSVLEDGTFVLAAHEHWDRARESQDVDTVRGEWESRGDGVRLIGEGWSAVLVTHEVPVSLHARRDTLSGLQCSETTGSAPLESAHFVRHDEFVDFVRPPEGFGTSPGGL
jgi:hypothetical protein